MDRQLSPQLHTSDCQSVTRLNHFALQERALFPLVGFNRGLAEDGVIVRVFQVQTCCCINSGSQLTTHS